MVRSIWIGLSTLALANLLALAGVLGWMWQSQRLSRERVDRVREIFAATVPAEAKKKDEEDRAAAEAARAAAEAAKVGRPPVSAEQRLEIIREYDESVRQRTQRIQRETQDLLRQLDERQAMLARQKSEFEAERDAFIRMRDEIAKREGDEQFGKAVGLYQSLPPEQSAPMLRVLIDAGKPEQVVSYLNAMQTRAASKLIQQFQQQDPKLAADLLERLRVYGLSARVPRERTDGEPTAGPDRDSQARSGGERGATGGTGQARGR
ncbi:MAG: hypothetical protein IBJ11_09480 [Phycisphaerales bacterium]|nr:hypothetical protein [Phycisphaerales bacterium]